MNTNEHESQRRIPIRVYSCPLVVKIGVQTELGSKGGVGTLIKFQIVGSSLLLPSQAGLSIVGLGAGIRKGKPDT